MDKQRAAMEAADRAYELELLRARRAYLNHTEQFRLMYQRAVDQAQIKWIAACDEARRIGPAEPPQPRHGVNGGAGGSW